MTSAYEIGADHVGRITLDRPEAKNALTIEMRDAIVDAVRDAREPTTTCARCSITGTGDAFCAGMDLSASTVAQGRRSPATAPAAPRRRCASACRRSSASSGSSTSRRSPR